MCSIKNSEDLETLEELTSQHNQAEEVRLQDKLGKPNVHESLRKYMNQLLIQLKKPPKIKQKL